MRREVIGDCELWCGDCLEVLPELPDACADLILTDPPYKVEMHGRGCIRRKIYRDSAEWSNIDLDLFGSDDVFDSWLRILKFPNIFSFCDKRSLRDLMNQAHKRGLSYTPVPLCKTNPTPFNNNSWLSKEEGLHICDRKLSYNGVIADKLPYFLESCGGKKESDHPNVKPQRVLTRLLRNLSALGQTVVDPYMGSGSTGVACAAMDRRFIGVELREKWFDTACRRIEEAVKTPKFDFTTTDQQKGTEHARKETA